VLLHGDFGAHNLAFDPATGMPIGVFDFHDVGRGAAEHDLKLLPLLGETFLARAVDRYAARARPLDLGDVRLVHAATALSSLAEGGDAPSAVRWAREAVRAATAQA
jgi:aminoglycoside phosphotransferase (APT) family kinase protein